MTKTSNIHQKAKIISHNCSPRSKSDITNGKHRTVDKEDTTHCIHDSTNSGQSTDSCNNYDIDDNNYDCNQIQLVRCNLDPYLIRHEVEVLHWDFIDRIKHITANCIIAAYYIGYLPTKTAKVNYHSYYLYFMLLGPLTNHD